MKAPDIMPLFAVPFASSQHPEAARLNTALRPVIAALERSGARNPNPLTQRNKAVFESHFDLFRHPDPAIQELKAFCWDQLLAVIGHLNGYTLKTLEQLQIYQDAWVHVTRRGGYFGLHNHPNASWSGVYCVDGGQHDADRTDSAALSFLNPATSSAMHMDAGVARIPLPYGTQMRNFRLDAGRLVMFPSWVLHEVKPFEGEGERITIAFNCWFTLPDSAL